LILTKQFLFTDTGGDIEELDENGPSYNLGLRKMEKIGVYR